MDTIYFDFVKAFDSVSHKRLLCKLKFYSINGNDLGWIKTFLSNCHQIVDVDEMNSDPATVLSGIPKIVSWDLYFSSYI